MDNYINMMCGNATPEQKESMKQMMTQTMERFKNNPEEMNTMLQQAANNPDMMRMFGGNFFNPTAPQPPMSPPGYPQQPPMSPPGYPQPMYPYQQPYFYPGQVQPSPTIPCSHGFYPRTEVDYSEQAKILVEMGYTNDTLNKEALKISNGDISVAVALLIEWMNKN
ncbi:hypothetical protein SLOPH_2556 [Spraguea lophii 42_110]|uniref:UBA domain-containing protein n=1 Tax=Spraguea lophii (strain 42_110) TaxID=1358809 RepID=S7W914_SPRLO|nr:hypothetical protein SLOPH_2556 [Spraguea lophii 42_110]